MSDADYRLELTITDPDGQASQVTLGPGQYFLGRNEDCDIRFPMTAKTISRKHASLAVSPERTLVRDLESRCGTMVNGRVIREHRLEPGDIISMAGYSVALKFPDRTRAAKPVVVSPEALAQERVAADLAGELERMRETTTRLFATVGQRIVGQEHIVRSIWAAILAKGHCLLIGVPGLAKTFMVTTFADALRLQSHRIQFTPDLMPSDIIGSNMIQKDAEGRQVLEFEQGPIFTQLLLADEINRTPPKTQAALLEAMQERQVTVADRSLTLPNPFCVIATQNPIEQEGTYPLPEAQQDRFMLCLVLDYPERDQEVDIILRTTQGQMPAIAPAMDDADIRRFQALVDRIAVSRDIAAFAADLVRQTRPRKPEAPDFVRDLVDWGAGPRAGQYLIRAAKALAAMDGRPAIAHDDVREMALPVLRHRISCNYRARTEGMTEDDLIQRLLERGA